jgi:serine/threonine-protein kinase 24/25/MST4
MNDDRDFEVDPRSLFSIISKIGSGNFGKVYKALDRTTGELVAIKTITIDEADNAQVTTILKEVELLRKCNSPYITGYKNVFYFKKKLWLVMEFCAAGKLVIPRK